MPTRVLDAVSIGILANRTLSRSGNAIVVARFEHSFCLDVGGTLITMGAQDLHDGPLNLRLTGHQGTSLSADLGIEVGQRWVVSPDRLRRTDDLAIDLTNAVVWRPDIPAARTDHSRLADGLDCLRRLLDGRELPEGGLMSLTLELSSPRTATERAALPHIGALKADLVYQLMNDAAVDLAPAIQLIGLGPGLTPSGDDLLAGLMIALHHVGASEKANRLGTLLLAAGAARTTPISLAHLDAATQGYAAAPLHRLLNAVTAGRCAEVAEALDVAAKIGHSSGLDAIAGMVLALAAWLKVKHEALIAA